MDCPAKLEFNHPTDACQDRSRSNCMIYLGEVEYGTKDSSFGTITLKSEVPDGVITQIKLEHISGSVTCHKGVAESKWGCNNNDYNYDEKVCTFRVLF